VVTSGLPIVAAVGMEVKSVFGIVLNKCVYSKVKIPCLASGAKGVTGKVNWEKLNGRLPYSYRIHRGILIIAKTTWDDAGAYRCTLNTTQGLASMTDVHLDFIPSFDGKGFVEVQPLPSSAWQQFDIQLTIKPRTSEGE
jgi:hypothetical protein